jgi:hypothetical protein
MANVNMLYETLDATNYLTEARNVNGEKTWYIKGPFAMAEKKNNNGRTYPWKVLSKGCDEYIEKYVKTKRALGCLDHPKTPDTDGSRFSHLVTKMWPNEEAKIYEGEATVMKKGCGLIVEGVFEMGGVLAVSTRGVGSLANGIVQENWKVFAIDLVHFPGASDCVVQAILEAEDYLKAYNESTFVPEYKEFKNTLEHHREMDSEVQMAIGRFLRGQ